MNQILESTSDLWAGWQGNLQLEFAQREGTTQLSRAFAQAPLKVQRPFYPEGSEVCHSVILHTAGGIVGSDRLSLNVSLHPQAHALITTASAAKVYRSKGVEAKQSTHLKVAAGACLEWLPQETIVFDGANYRQNLRVDLAEDSLWLGWEMTRLGRSARGEKFASGEWRSHTEVWQNNQLLWVDPQWLQGGSEMLTSLHGLNNYPVVASFALVGRSLPNEVIEKARQLWAERKVGKGDRPGEAGVTRLMSGMLCRYRGCSSLEARRWFTEVWHLMRLACLNRPSCNSRVWPS
ncbi:urease accessory protein UreD [Leptolyngbya sp. FACHB-541]|uniref:urease accessory protein UreD n=1 Tax=Leptolyngbya sp. FACHB-541 TaxID=2692810 RepID=UPI00168230AE|nr:urease accessory protein UreD [Leptolyngbya sp. FACHB-541]